jgi:hypothetical protein
LEADKVLANHSIQVAGELCTTRGAKSSAVVIGRGSRFAGPIVADEVEIGKELAFAQGVLDRLSPERLSTIGRMTRVDDVHARAVKMWHYSRAKKIFAERVEMGEGTIADKIEYTKELALPRNYHVEEQATKVERLPDPPL